MLRLEKMNAYCVCGLHHACECGKFYLTVSLEKYIFYIVPHVDIKIISKKINLE